MEYPQQAELPITIYQGETFPLPVQYLQEDEETPVNLTGYTAKMQIRTSATETDPLVDLSSDEGEITIDTTTGTVTATISAEKTAALPAGFKGRYDLFIFAPGATVAEVLVFGPVAVQARITQ